MTMGSLSRMLSGIHQSVESEVNPFVSLTTHSSSVQVKDDISPPETITIREILSTLSTIFKKSRIINQYL